MAYQTSLLLLVGEAIPQTSQISIIGPFYFLSIQKFIFLLTFNY